MAELGTKENPHSYIRGQKDRIDGHYYFNSTGKIRVWRWNQFINQEEKNEKARKYRRENKDQIRKYQRTENYKKNQKAYRDRTKDRKREYDKTYRDKNKLRRKKAGREYYKKNKNILLRKQKVRMAKTENKEKRNKYLRNRKQENPLYKLKCNLRSRISMEIKKSNASKNTSTINYLNCSIEHLHNHLESQFGDSGMNWDNMGREDGEGGRGWEIDHRRPCASFDLNDEEQIYMCFHWTNLQPMWGEENNKKHDYYDPKTFRYKWIDRETGWVGIPSYLMNKK